MISIGFNMMMYENVSNPKWLIVGDYGSKYGVSNDGINWFAATAPFSGARCVGHNGSMWVIGGNGTLAYSYNGINWTTVSSPIETQINHIAWNGTMWVAVGQGWSRNSIMYSYDGINWTCVGNGIFYFAKGIAWNGTMWVAGGSNSSGTTTLASSSDGINWTNLNITLQPGLITSVAWNGTMWVAGGMTSTGGQTLLTSPDGINWTGRGSVIGATINAIVWNGSIWVAGGNDGWQGGYAFATSSNGINWTSNTNGNFFKTGCSSLFWNGSMFVAGGTDGAGGKTLAYSLNGTTWNDLGNSIFYTFCLGVCCKKAPNLYPPRL